MADSDAARVGVAERAGWPALRGGRAAFVFFSRLPVGGFPYHASDWHWAPAHLPLVGSVVGGLSAVVFGLGHWLGLPPLLTAPLVLAASAWVTGALHEDGLADTADGLGGAPGDPKRALEIMKDSRIGTYGALALLLGVSMRAAAIAALAPAAWFALVFVHVWARVGPVALLAALPYVNDRPDAKSQGLFQTRPRHVLVALGWGVGTAALGVGLGWLPWPAAIVAALAPLASSAWLGRRFCSQLGGVTGDLLGATEQVGEIAAWVALAAALH